VLMKYYKNKRVNEFVSAACVGRSTMTSDRRTLGCLVCKRDWHGSKAGLFGTVNQRYLSRTLVLNQRDLLNQSIQQYILDHAVQENTVQQITHQRTSTQHTPQWPRVVTRPRTGPLILRTLLAAPTITSVTPCTVRSAQVL